MVKQILLGVAFIASAAATAESPNNQWETAVVKRVAPTTGSVTLAHGPLKSLGMPAMSMTFVATEPKQLVGLKAGDAVKFLAENNKGVLTVTRILQDERPISGQ